MKNAETVLKYMIAFLIQCLEELSDATDLPDRQFCYGEKTAFVECLEVLADWEQAEKNGLDFNVEERFPL